MTAAGAAAGASPRAPEGFRFEGIRMERDATLRTPAGG